MVDANYSMGVEQAIRFAKSIEKYDITGLKNRLYLMITKTLLA